jgi:hypothetical protein
MKHKLKVYWHDIDASEGIMAHWGQLGYALLRIQFAVSEMETSIKNMKDLQSIYRLQYQVENYYERIYELRERLCAFVAALLNIKSAKEMLLDPAKQKKLDKIFPITAKGCVAPLKRVLKVVNDDVKIRKVHTHSVFIRIGYLIKTRYVDIEDLYWDFEEDNITMGKIFKNITKDGSYFVGKYKTRVDYIDRNTQDFLRCLLPYLRTIRV